MFIDKNTEHKLYFCLLSSIKVYFISVHFLNWCCAVFNIVSIGINFQPLQFMAGTLKFVHIILKLHITVSELLNLRTTCWWFSFVLSIRQNVTRWKKKKQKWKCHQKERKKIVLIYLPVLTEESESKKSSFLSWLTLRVEEFCWLDGVPMCGFACCCWWSKVSNLSSHCETLSNLSNFDDSSISTFFTINFVVRLRVSIFKTILSLVLTGIKVYILKTKSNKVLKIKFSEFLRFKLLNRE